MLGYAITKTGEDALAPVVFDHEAVRFVASLSTGEGFVAFEGDGAVVNEIAALTQGRILTAADPDPEFFPFCPKRHVGTGTEVFSLLRPEATARGLLNKLREDRATRQCVVVSGNQAVNDWELFVLVETDGWVPLRSEWAAQVVQFEDKRLELVSA